MQEEEQQKNNTPPNTEQLETSINELVEVIKQQEEQKIEEKTLIEEQTKIEEKELQEQQVLLEKEELLLQEQQLAKEQAETDFKEQVINYMSIEEPTPTDYTIYLEEISNQLSTLNEQNDTIIQQNEILITGSNTTLTYGIFYIPLAIIVFLLWRFFSTFLRSFR